MLWMIKQVRPTQVHLTFTRDILLCSYYYTAVEKWCNSLVQNFGSWLIHTKNSPLPRLYLKSTQSVTLESLALTASGVLNDCLFTSWPLPLELTAKILDQVLWKILLPRVWIYWVDYCLLYRRVIWQLLTPCSVIKKLAAVIRTAMEIRVVLVVKDRL